MLGVLVYRAADPASQKKSIRYYFCWYPNMPLSWNEIRHRAIAFSKEWSRGNLLFWLLAKSRFLAQLGMTMPTAFSAA
jgi:hypothetical protein